MILRHSTTALEKVYEIRLGEFQTRYSRRARNARLRRKLQKKGTKSAKRLMRRRRRKERRFAADVNHQISKKIVAAAQRTESGIALEDLKGIRRVRANKKQRA